jgi:hypothetical protein
MLMTTLELWAIVTSGVATTTDATTSKIGRRIGRAFTGKPIPV